jgi:hypothetical protein
MAGALGGLVAHLTFRVGARWRVPATVGFGAAAGVLHLGLLLLATLPTEVATRGAGGLDVIGMAGVIGAFGSIVSAPMGAAFGALFLVTTWPATRSLEAPSHDGPAWVAGASALQLTLAAGIALALLHAAEGPYCQALFVVALPSLGVHLPEGSDLAWTRHLLASPLVIGALLAFARGLWLELVLSRCAHALRRDVHPRWRKTATEASPQSVVPLLALERGRKLFEVVARDEAGPYRGASPALTAIAEDA